MYLVSYDISDDRTRTKIAKELLNYGRRVQYSVFECSISEKQCRELYQKLMALMLEHEEGNIRIYKLCEKCVKNIHIIGLKNKKDMEEQDLFII